MEFVSLKIGKKRTDIASFNPLNIVKVQAASKGNVCFVDLLAGPKFTAFTIYERYEDVMTKISNALEA